MNDIKKELTTISDFVYLFFFYQMQKNPLLFHNEGSFIRGGGLYIQLMEQEAGVCQVMERSIFRRSLVQVLFRDSVERLHLTYLISFYPSQLHARYSLSLMSPVPKDFLPLDA
jgi:hypothetical protein